MMAQCQYSPLQAGGGEIRLIRLLPGLASADIEIEIYHKEMSSNPTYEALSYVWGSPELTDVVSVIE
jgi:hypothetical protein